MFFIENSLSYDMMRLNNLGILLLIITTVNGVLRAQNVIPNPGFEESTNGKVNHWVQPKGTFYHYSSKMVLINGVPTLESTNALHIGNTSVGAEYMYVKLNTPLKKDVTYCAKMKVKMPSLNKSEGVIVESLGWSWVDEEPDISGRTFLYQTPSISFPLTNLNIYDDFVELSQVYTAVGGEQILVIGKFFEKADYSSNLAVREILSELRTTYNVVKLQLADSFNRLYPQLPDHTKIKSKRKVRKLFNEFDKEVSDILMQKKRVDDSLIMVYQPKIDSLNKLLSGSNKTVDILTYFDDFCLSPIISNRECNCDTKHNAAQFVLGETYRLNGVSFETDKFDLSVEAMNELDVLFLVLKNNPNFKVKILGHTDNTANNNYNLKLSENRSKACANYLMRKGISANRVSWSGLGSTKPLVSNDTEEGRDTNRRVEFVLDK